MSLEVINRNIRNIARADKTQRERIQTTLVLVIAHAMETGDANPAKRLVEAVNPRFRKPVVDFLTTYSRINVTKAKGGFTCGLSKAESRADNLEGARANMWYEQESATKDDLPTDILDVDKKIESMANWLAKRIEEGKIVGDVAAYEDRLARIKALKAA